MKKLFVLFFLTTAPAHAADVKVQLLESTDGKTTQTLIVVNCPKDVKADHVIVETLYATITKIGDKEIPLVRIQTDVGSYIPGVEYGIASLAMPKSLIKRVTVTLVTDVSKTVLQTGDLPESK